jgi:hypothetical protein
VKKKPTTSVIAALAPQLKVNVHSGVMVYACKTSTYEASLGYTG